MQLDKIIQVTEETEAIYRELIETLVDERLHQKTYWPGAAILEKDEKLDSLIVVLEGMLYLEQDGWMMEKTNPDQIVAQRHLQKQTLSLHQDINLPKKKLNMSLHSADIPGVRTEILSVYLDDIESVYQMIRERVNQQ